MTCYIAKLTQQPRSGSGSVDFQEFVGGLSAFSSKGGREEKLRCECLTGCSGTQREEGRIQSRMLVGLQGGREPQT